MTRPGQGETMRWLRSFRRPDIRAWLWRHPVARVSLTWAAQRPCHVPRRRGLFLGVLAYFQSLVARTGVRLVPVRIGPAGGYRPEEELSRDQERYGAQRRTVVLVAALRAVKWTGLAHRALGNGLPPEAQVTTGRDLPPYTSANRGTTLLLCLRLRRPRAIQGGPRV